MDIDSNTYFKVMDIFNNEPRSRWKELITPYIKGVDLEIRASMIGEDEAYYFFLPEELDPNYNWKFNIGDVVTDGESLLRITGYPILDPRREFSAIHVQYFGNKYHVDYINEKGEVIGDEDPTLYLHQDFNEDEIHLV